MKVKHHQSRQNSIRFSLYAIRLLSFIFLISNFQTKLYSQTAPLKKYIKISGGNVLFGTGDVSGYGVAIEGVGNFIRKNNYLSRHLQVGGEIYFQSGVSNPVVENPEPNEYPGKTFRHSSLVGLNAKANFYPFKKTLRGLNISLAMGAAYYNASSEGRSVYEQYLPEVSRRMSELRFDNRVLLGYIVSLGYDFTIVKDILQLGIHYDLANYNNGDFNNALCGKMGFRF